AGDRWYKCLTTPTGRGKASPGCRASRVRLIEGWRIRQSDIAGAAGEVTIGKDAGQKVRLRRVCDATAGRRKRQREILRGRQAIVDHDIGDREGIVPSKTGG